jgi:hypothetical protein
MFAVVPGLVLIFSMPNLYPASRPAAIKAMIAIIMTGFLIPVFFAGFDLTDLAGAGAMRYGRSSEFSPEAALFFSLHSLHIFGKLWPFRL